MKKFAVYIFLFFLAITSIYASDIKGQILDSKTKQPLAFVNVGLTNRVKGTTSNEDGLFDLKDCQGSDRIKFSMIGYEIFELEVNNLINTLNNNNGVVYLKAKSFELETIDVKARKKIKSKTLGVKACSQSVWFGLGSSELGAEVALLIENDLKNAVISNISFCIATSPYDTLYFRVNIYDALNGMPDKNILTKPIIVRTVGVGRNTINIEEYNIRIDGDFFVGLEYYQKLGTLPSSDIGFSTSLIKGKTYSRYASHAPWKLQDRLIMKGIGITADVKY